MGEPKQAVIFDLDGVLVDSFSAHVESWRRLAKERGYLFARDDFVVSFGRTSRAIIIEHWARNLDDDTLSALVERKDELFREIVAEKLTEVPGAVRLVESLDDDGFSLALEASGPMENVDLCLDRLGCRDCFDAIVTACDVDAGKPNPDVLLEAASQLDLEPSRCVAIENSAPGVAAGRAAGMMVVGIASPTGPACRLNRADVVGTSLRQISPDTLAELIDRRTRRFV